MKELILVLAIFLSIIYCQPCPKYESKDLEGDTCLQKNDAENKIYLKSCGQDKRCNYTSSRTSGMCIEQSIGDLYPGEYCTNNTTCSLGKCDKNSHCIGANENDKCSSTKDCNPGLYCHNTKKICTKAMREGGLCSKTEPCVASMVCDKGFCVRWASLYSDDLASNVNSCITNFIKGGKCVEGPMLYSSDYNDEQNKSKRENIKDRAIFNCTKSCTYKLGKDTFDDSSKCVCINADTGYKYCPLGKGDFILDQVSFHC